MIFTNVVDKETIPVILDSESKNNEQNKKEKEKLLKVNSQSTFKAK